MPTTVPRIAVTLDSTAYEAVRYLALASGTSMSKVVAQVVEAVAPVLSRTADVLAAAKQAQSDQRAGLIAAAAEAEARMRTLAVQAGMATEDVLGRLERAATGGQPAKAGADGGRAPDPRASNTGVRSRGKRGSKTPRRKARR